MPPYRRSQLQEKPSAHKRELEISSLFSIIVFVVIFALLDPDPIQPTKINAAPDPKHWLKLLKSQRPVVLFQLSKIQIHLTKINLEQTVLSFVPVTYNSN
jgi:hypothetical protein